MKNMALLAGIYRHYKGHLYLVLGQAQDADDEDRVVVVYVGLDLQGAKNGYRMSVRTVEHFMEFVDPGTGLASTGSGAVLRFSYVGPSTDPR